MATNTERYTVLSMNINGYELIHPVGEKSDRARYVMVTDDPNLKDESGTWEVVYDPDLSGSTYDRVMQVRYNPFKYTDDYYIIKVDGSVGVNKNLDPLIDKFIEGKYDISLMFHPTRTDIISEYGAWCGGRQLPVPQANKVLKFMVECEGYDVKGFKGLCQLCYAIQANSRLNNDLNRMTYSLLKYLGDNDTEIERVDQCVFSFVMQKYFAGANILWVDQRMYCSEWFTWYAHNSNDPFTPVDPKQLTEPYWNNKRVHNQLRPQDL